MLTIADYRKIESAVRAMPELSIHGVLVLLIQRFTDLPSEGIRYPARNEVYGDVTPALGCRHIKEPPRPCGPEGEGG